MLATVVRRNLTLVGSVYGTDKAGGEHLYTPHYRHHLYPLRKRPVKLLEIGVGGYNVGEGGASLRMWRTYFSRGVVHGLDVYPKLLDEPRVFTHEGSQEDAALLHDLGRKHGPFDIIIDDGSHRSSDVITSFEALFHEHLRQGGWYVIEDLATAYAPELGGHPPGDLRISTTLVASLVDDINAVHWRGTDRVARPVAELHVYEQIAFIRRR